VILDDKIYSSPNRFFAHWTMSAYFKSVPFLLQHFISPIDIVYVSCAIAKTGIQLLLLFLLASYISGTSNILKREFIVSAALVTPLFQTFGYAGVMGIILQSITYTFFYSLPCALLLLFFLPFFKALYHGNSFRPGLLQHIALFLLAVILSFNGPIVTGIVLIACTLTLLHQWWKHFNASTQLPLFQRAWYAVKKIPAPFLIHGILFTMLCCYSFWIGRSNAENFGSSISLADRYCRIPLGLFEMITNKLGLPLLILMISVNAVIIHKQFRKSGGERILKLLKGFTLFSVLYILLLPLGGYRAYRPEIVRFDTMMPVIIGLILFYGCSSFFILKNLSLKYRRFFVVSIIFFSIIYINADSPNFDNNNCERRALEQLSVSKSRTVLLDSDCTVMEWRKITDAKQSELNSRLLQLFGITKEQTLYYQK
jgi:hypothetical protein